MKLLIMLCMLFSTSIYAKDSKKEIIAKLENFDDLYRSSSSYAKLEMIIETPHWKRTMLMDSWSKGKENSFIRILSPRKEKGVASLKKGNEMWNFFPKINKVIKVPSSMMMGSWMGSDFTNDDLVREYRFSEDFEFQTEETKEGIIIHLIPKKYVVSIWGKMSLYLDLKDNRPLQLLFYDENSKLVRKMMFKDFRKVGTRLIPFIMELIPVTKKGNKTTVKYLELKLDLEIPDNIFTKRNLEKRA